MKFGIKVDEDGAKLGCDDCASEVPLKEFNDDRSTKMLCIFCASSTGKPNNPIEKVAVCQIANILLQKLSK